MKKCIVALTLAGVLSIGIVGCGQQQQASSSSQQSEKTEQTQQKDATVKWTDVNTAEEAAKGAGLEKFGVPQELALDAVVMDAPKFTYADGVAQAKYEKDGTTLVLRKAGSNHNAPLTDVDTKKLDSKWTKDYDGIEVTLYGKEEGAATVLTWKDGEQEYGVAYQDEKGEQTLTSYESAAIVKAVHDANAEEQQQSSSSEQASSSSAKQEEQKKQDGQEDQSSSSTNDNNGMEAKYDQDTCIKIATDHNGATGQTSNLTVNGPTNGGGTIYYIVEYDFNGSHYRVMVDAIGGNVVDSSQTGGDGNGETNVEAESNNDNGNDGMAANYSINDCIQIATDFNGATGQASNLTASGPTNGGGTIYYIVGYDFNGSHYRVMVDAIGGNVVDSSIAE